VVVDVEWKGQEHYDPGAGEEWESCPSCGSHRDTHNDDCLLKAALARAEDALEGGE
jgi:hypothetical protein